MEKYKNEMEEALEVVCGAYELCYGLSTHNDGMSQQLYENMVAGAFKVLWYSLERVNEGIRRMYEEMESR
jgi:hypothetical protein